MSCGPSGSLGSPRTAIPRYGPFEQCAAPCAHRSQDNQVLHPPVPGSPTPSRFPLPSWSPSAVSPTNSHENSDHCSKIPFRSECGRGRQRAPRYQQAPHCHCGDGHQVLQPARSRSEAPILRLLKTRDALASDPSISELTLEAVEYKTALPLSYLTDGDGVATAVRSRAVTASRCVEPTRPRTAREELAHPRTSAVRRL